MEPRISIHEGKVMTCPVCQANLTVFVFNGVEVDVCSEHHCGIWFDCGEMATVEKQNSLPAIDEAFAGEFKKRPVEESLADPTRCCPHDGAELERYHWNLGSGIVLDRCPKDGGVWMDAGEIEGYAFYVKRFRETPPTLTPELAAKLKDAETTAERHFNESLQRVTQSAVPWDFYLFDDMLRGLLKGVLRPFTRS